MTDLNHATNTEDVLASELPPTATYHTDPDELGLMTVTDALFEDRPQFFVSGRVTATIKGETVGARISFKVSPDYRKKIDFETKEGTEKFDLPSRLWAQAENTYKAVLGDKPKTVEQVTEFLSQGRYAMRGVQFTGNDGTVRFMIISLGPVGKRL